MHRASMARPFPVSARTIPGVWNSTTSAGSGPSRSAPAGSIRPQKWLPGHVCFPPIPPVANGRQSIAGSSACRAAATSTDESLFPSASSHILTGRLGGATRAASPAR